MRAANGCLVFFDLVVLTRWLLIGLLISVGALLFAAGALVRHVLRQRRVRVDGASSAETVVEVGSLPSLTEAGGNAGEASLKSSRDSEASGKLGGA